MYSHMNMQWGCILHVSDRASTREKQEEEEEQKDRIAAAAAKKRREPELPFVAITKYTTPICIAVQATLFIHLGDDDGRKNERTAWDECSGSQRPFNRQPYGGAFHVLFRGNY